MHGEKTIYYSTLLYIMKSLELFIFVLKLKNNHSIAFHEIENLKICLLFYGRHGNGNQLWYQMNNNKILGKSPKVWMKTDTNSRRGEQIYGGVTPFGFLGLTQHSSQNNLSKLFYEISKQKYNFLKQKLFISDPKWQKCIQ